MAEYSLDWFVLPVIHNIDSEFNCSDELNEIDEIRRKAKGLIEDFETTNGYFSLGRNTIIQLSPKAFIPKDRENRKYYTEVVFENGEVVFSVGKPEVIYQKLNEYYNSIAGKIALDEQSV